MSNLPILLQSNMDFSFFRSYIWEMGSENSDHFGPAVVLVDEDEQEVGGLINSDGEEVEYSEVSK